MRFVTPVRYDPRVRGNRSARGPAGAAPSGWGGMLPMMQTIALVTLAYAGLLGFVLTLLTAAKRGDQGSDSELPTALLSALERERRRSAA